MDEHLSNGYVPRSNDGTYDLTTTEPRAVVRVRFMAASAIPGRPSHRGTEYLPAANQPSSVLIPQLIARGHDVDVLVDVAIVCEACQYPVGALTHTAC